MHPLPSAASGHAPGASTPTGYPGWRGRCAGWACAMASHASLLTMALGQQATIPAVHPGGRALLALPMFHIGAFTLWLPQLVVGGTQVIVPAFEPRAVLETIARHRVTTALLVPTMLQRVVDHPALPEFDLSSLRALLYGAS